MDRRVACGLGSAAGAALVGAALAGAAAGQVLNPSFEDGLLPWTAEPSPGTQIIAEQSVSGETVTPTDGAQQALVSAGDQFILPESSELRQPVARLDGIAVRFDYRLLGDTPVPGFPGTYTGRVEARLVDGSGQTVSTLELFDGSYDSSLDTGVLQGELPAGELVDRPATIVFEVTDSSVLTNEQRLDLAVDNITLVTPPVRQLLINELLFDPRQQPDNDREFIELFTPDGNQSLDGLSIVVIEGEAGQKGLIDSVQSLDGLETGENGLLLIQRTDAVLQPPPEAETPVVVSTDTVFENGSATYLIVRGFTGSVGQDLDTDNDRFLDVFPWDAVVDAIGVLDLTNVAADQSYAEELGREIVAEPVSDQPGGPLFAPRALIRVNPGLSVRVGLVPGDEGDGPFEIDPDFDVGLELGPGATLTPGSSNSVLLAFSPADFNEDGVVDVFDLVDFLVAFALETQP